MGIGSAVKNAEEIKTRLEAKEAEPEEQPVDDPRLRREWAFDFKYTDGAGRTWSGPFKNRILNIEQSVRVGVMRATLCDSQPIDALDLSTYHHAEALAHLTVSLVERPKWARDLGKLDDPGLLRALYREVSSHEEIFRGRATDSGSGEAPGDDAAG